MLPLSHINILKKVVGNPGLKLTGKSMKTGPGEGNIFYANFRAANQSLSLIAHSNELQLQQVLIKTWIVYS